MTETKTKKKPGGLNALFAEWRSDIERGKKKGKQKEFERRSFSVAELRATTEGKTRKIGGYAAVFDQWADDGWGGRERVRPGAFKKTLKEQPDIRALWNHNSDIVLGRTSNKTLRLSEDERGLAIEIDLPDTQAGRDAHTLVERGDVSQMSFGFNIIKSSEEKEQDDASKVDFNLEEVRLHEVSPVTFPFYPTTEISAREMRSALEKAGAEEGLIESAIKNLRASKPAEPGDEAHSQEHIGEPTDSLEPGDEAHSEQEQDKPEVRKAEEPGVEAHSEATETREEESTETVASKPDPETSTGELFTVSKTLIKSLKRREQTLRQNLDAQFKKIEEEKNEHRST